MRVSMRMTLALSAACLVIMGLHGYDQLRNEDRDLHAAVDREMRLLGDAVRVGVEASLRDRQMQDIQGLLPGGPSAFTDAGSRRRLAAMGRLRLSGV